MGWAGRRLFVGGPLDGQRILTDGATHVRAMIWPTAVTIAERHGTHEQLDTLEYTLVRGVYYAPDRWGSPVGQKTAR